MPIITVATPSVIQVKVGPTPNPSVGAIQYGSHSLRTLTDVDARLLVDGYGLVYSAANNNFFLTNIGSSGLILSNVANLQIAQTQTNANISLLFAINTTQNTNIQSAWNTANTASSNTVYLLGVTNSQNNTISYIFGVDASQNTVIQNLQTYLNSNNAYNTGVNAYQNTAIDNANTLAQTATSLVIAAGANTVYLKTNLNTANANIAYILAVNNLQNTNISNANTLAQSAYTLAGTKFNSNGGTIAGSVTIQNNLTVLGNVSYTGNVISVQVSGNTGQFFGYAANGFNALYAGIPIGYFIEPQISFQVSSNYNGYAGINMQNINSGSNSSSDLFITADNGTINDGFVDLGMGSSTYSYPGYNLIGKNDGYLFATGNTTTGGGNMIIGTGLPNDVIFATGGITTNNEVMRITSANTVVIKSQVPSTSNTTGALTVAGGVGIGGNLYANTIVSSNVSIGTSLGVSTIPLQVEASAAGDGIRVTRRNVPGQYLALTTTDGSQHLIQSIGDKPFKIITNSPSFPIEFYTNTNILAMSLLSSGNVGIKTATANFPLDVNGTANISGRIISSNVISNGVDLGVAIQSVTRLTGITPYANVTYASTVTLTPNTNNRLILTGDLTLRSPLTAGDGDIIRIWATANGGARNFSLDTANTVIPNTSTFTSPVSIASGKKARLSIQFDAVRNKWELVSFVNGY